MNNRDQWAELGVAKRYLYHEQHVEDLDVDRAPMMMSGLLVDCQSRHWKLICAQMQKFPRAHIDPSQDIIKKIIDKHILFTAYHHMTRDKCGRLSIYRGSRPSSRIWHSGAGATYAHG